jgi:hypothetical protein
MLEFFWLPIYLCGFIVGMGVGTRVFYGIERRSDPSGRVISAYQMAVLQGAICGLLWFIALPLLLVFGVGWQAARVVAPPEVRREVSAFNTAMMERALGVADERKFAALAPAGVLDSYCKKCRWHEDGSVAVVPGCIIHDGEGKLMRMRDRY